MNVIGVELSELADRVAAEWEELRLAFDELDEARSLMRVCKALSQVDVFRHRCDVAVMALLDHLTATELGDRGPAA